MLHPIRTLAPLSLLAALLFASPAEAQRRAAVDCEMRFSTSGWSLFYKTARGTGTVTCNNGQRMDVRIRAKGGGLTVGKSSIEDGRAEFSGVYDIREVLGSYAAAEAHAGAVKSAKGSVMTKGEVSMALSGTGRGWDVGVAFGKFQIQRR
jgi:hypothetical protein